MKTGISSIAVVVVVLAATSAWGGDGFEGLGELGVTSMDQVGLVTCNGSNANDVCTLDNNTPNSVVCIQSELVGGVTKLKHFAHKAICFAGNPKTLFRYWCADGHTVKSGFIACDAGDYCHKGQCHHYDAQSLKTTSYPLGTNAVGYAELYGSTDAANCSKQDNALQNICKTVDANKGIETQFPSAWSRLKYYGGCK